MCCKIKDFIKNSDSRTAKAKINILQMLMLKGGSVFITLLLVPLTLGYVDNETYGVWLVINSMVAWVSFFDIGISNSLKNKLAEALANKNYILGKKYVSTTYAILSALFLPLMVVLLVISYFIPWSTVLNVQNIENHELTISIAIMVCYFCMNFILSALNSVILAEQNPAEVSWRTFIQQVLSVITIYLLTIFTKGNLVNLCLGLCIAPLVTILYFNINLFSGKYKNISPSLSDVDLSMAPDLFKLGLQFFIIQIAGIIQYQMSNFLIIRHFGASEVTEYNIGYRYFNVLLMVWSIFVSPLWVAFTDAYTRKDFAWIRKTLRAFSLLLVLFVIGGIAMLLFSNYAYSIWVGGKVHVHNSVSFWLLIYTVVSMFSLLVVTFLNGIGKVKTQTIACVFSPIVFLMVFYTLLNYDWGVPAIIIASIICNFNGYFLAPIQVIRFLKAH